MKNPPEMSEEALFQGSQEKALNSNLLQVKADRAELLQLQRGIYLRSAFKGGSLEATAESIDGLNESLRILYHCAEMDVTIAAITSEIEPLAKTRHISLTLAWVSSISLLLPAVRASRKS
jgi:hypothetical protein